MSYDFSFDKKSVFFLLGGCVAIGLLLFFAGFVVGWDRGETEARLEFEKDKAVVAAQKTPPVDNVVVAKSTPAPELQVAKPSPAQPEQKPAEAAPAKSPQPETSASANGQTAAAQNSPPKSSSPQQPAAAATEPEANGFSLQVGAFQNETNAMRWESILKARGHQVFVFDTVDGSGRKWHTIRLGHFADMQKAQAEAAVFTRREKLPVFVRPVNEL